MVVKSTLLLLFALIATGCVPPPPMPSDIPKVDAFTVLEDYTSNEERANRNYKGKWFTVRGIVDKVDTGGVVYLDNGYRFEQLYMDFDDTEDTLRLDAGDRIEANCVIKGLRLNLYVSFDNCRFPQQEATATAAIIDTNPATTLPAPASYARVGCNPGISSPGTKLGAGKVAELEAFIPPAGFEKFHDRLLPVLRDASQVGERVTGQPISRDVLDLILTLAGDFSIRTRPPSYSSLYSFLPAIYDLNQESKAALLAAGCLLPSF